MKPTDGGRGIAFVSTPEGTIVRIIRDELGLAATFLPGVSFVTLLAGAGAAKAHSFLDVLNERQAAFGWDMAVTIAGQPTPMHFAGTAQEGHLCIVAARNVSEPEDIAQALSAINNEQTNALRSTVRELTVQDLDRHLRDSRLYDDLSRLNNELANLEREMAKKNAQLEKLNVQKNRVLGMAAHDLRSPLGVIQSYSEFLQDEAGDVLDEEQREFVAVIKSTSEFMLHMVTDILDVTAIEAGQLTLSRQPTDLARLIQHSATLNKVLAGRKGIDVEVDPMPALPPVSVDAGKIEQVLNNLLGNAVKFSHRGSMVRVRVTCADECVTVAVVDAGQGIPEADLPKLFKPFGKASVRGTAGELSTGLGLAIVRNIVEGHGGRIWLESTVGIGSTFFFTIPIR